MVSGDENGTGVVATTRSGDGPEFKVHLVYKKSTLERDAFKDWEESEIS